MNSISAPSANAGDLWGALVKAALLGTDRVPLPDLRAEGPHQELLAQIDVNNKEKALLIAAALFSVHISCGYVPEKAIGDGIAPAEADSVPRCKPTAAAYLSRILRGEFTFLLPEFLSALRIFGQRIPEELLPETLEAGSKDAKIRADVAKVIGRRGEWLASLNEDWHYIAGKINTEEWETSSRASRVFLLKSLRASDPAAGLNLLISTWSQRISSSAMDGRPKAFLGLIHKGDSILGRILSVHRKLGLPANGLPLGVPIDMLGATTLDHRQPYPAEVLFPCRSPNNSASS